MNCVKCNVNVVYDKWITGSKIICDNCNKYNDEKKDEKKDKNNKPYNLSGCLFL
jgi:hypothetical protein